MEGEASFGSYSTAVYSRELLETIQLVNMGVERERKPEIMALRPERAPQPEVMGIFGTGDLGRSVGLRLLQSGTAWRTGAADLTAVAPCLRELR